MKKSFILLIITVAIIVVFFEGKLFDSIFAFLIAGIIPGTSVALPFWAMLIIYGSLLGLLIATTTLEYYRERQVTKRLIVRRSRMPKRRYSHI